MKSILKNIFFGPLLILVWVAPIFCQEPDAVPLPTGVQAVWDMDKVVHETTPTRERICINGLWKWRPALKEETSVPTGGWGYFKVPGPWVGGNDWQKKQSQNVYANPAWKDQNLEGVKTAWYQREITVPSGWAGRRITLSLEYLNSYAAVYVDGKKVGEARFPAGEVDLTPACPPGGKYVLSLYVVAAPLKAIMVSNADTSAPKTAEGSVERKGLCGDVFLTSTPKEARVDDTQILTSVRKWEITFRATLKDLSPDSAYSLRALVTENGQKVKEFQSAPFKGADLKDGLAIFAEKWKPAHLWDLDSPQNQYRLSLSLVANGKIADTAQPISFGFREFWIEGKDFYLNGTRLHLSVEPNANALLGAGMATYAACRETFKRFKDAGFNGVYSHNYGCEPGSHISYAEVLKAADDAGMLYFLAQPHFDQYEWDAADADQTNGYASHAAFYVRVAGNHPSVVMYAMSHNAMGYGGDTDPDQMDGLVEPKRDEWSRRNAERAVKAETIVRRLDPGRIIYHHSSGNMGAMHSVNFYLNFIPVQEMSDFFEHWSAKGVKPLYLCEFGVPLSWDWTMYRGFYKGQREFGSAPVPWEVCAAEWNAQFLGDRAYRIPEAEKRDLRWEAQQFKEGKVWHRWDYPIPISTQVLEEGNEVFAEYFRDNLRALRAWGVSAYCIWDEDQHWFLRNGVDQGRKDFPVDWANLQRPGFSPDYIESRYEGFETSYELSDWVPTAGGKEILKNNGPLLAYIGGKPFKFTSKDHNFLPGEKVEKQLIVINDTRKAVACACSWSLNTPVAMAGNASVTLQPGNQQRVPFMVKLPLGLNPGSYSFSATFQFSNGETQQDSFGLNVMAPAADGKFSGKIALFDPSGETTKTLTGLGISFDPVGADADLSSYDLLLIGKSALSVEGAAPDLSRVRQGLKVVLFEQSSEALEKRLGFRVEEYGLRKVFERVPDSPLLAGLKPENLRDWRGQATLLPPRLKYEMKPEHGPTVQWCGIDVARPWRVGCQGNVASVLIEKPPKGNFLPILDGGFSLAYSPLMEYREGKGMVLFCQMDVTGRTESDPAAEKLVRNILDYASTWKPAPSRTVLYAGEAAGKSYLESLGLTLGTYSGKSLSSDQVVVVGPGGGSKLATHSADVADWLKGGGNLLALGLEEKDANAFLPFKVGMKKAEHIAAYFETQGGNSILAGLGPADVHNRAPRDFPLVSEGAQPVGDGVLAQEAGTHAVFCQLLPWQYGYEKNYGLKRTFRKASVLVGRLLGNMGVAGSTPLLERFHTAPDVGKEKRYLDGFYLDTPEEWDDPYRFFGW